ncbi:putative 115 kDa protein in type-1 retrotransposable element R1DM [Fusarium oxysporum f. sp. cubense]|uniref:Putative 115 kDa protein in type-1 retrotransposable element R1DM n=1 Tax=Fusarium oxysporum f. sp. cubense TaxID=61366 RepID=A0A559KSF3_FUSOC|nr:putative 115 kDa protein in type-1 retrotransposable element R1DM [Fusarium oxysporum f. sp. cubense]
MGTSRRPRARRCEKKTLRVFQANVGKVLPVHDCALALADSERYDIVLLQEPWTTTANSRCLTKTHPAYDTYSPVEAWNSNSTRPRVMTYVRPDSKLSVDQNRPYQSRDILWLTVNDTIVVNFYRQNEERDALDTLLQWPIPYRCLVAGDFNARHHTWQTGPTTNRGHEIASWASENGLGLLNTSEMPTNRHGNTIDLAFSNVPLAEANVEDHLATSSDHFTLSLTLPNVEPAPTQPGKIRVTTDDELKRFVEIVEPGSTAIPVAASSPLELDKLASTLVSLLQSAAKAAGRSARKGARNAPWWTEECALAAAGYRAIRRLYPLGFNQEVQIAKRDFHRVVRRAKRLYWRNLINSFSDSSSVFKAVQWLRSPGAFQPPPLQVDDVVYETQLDKANALRRATLERRTAEDDIQDPWIEDATLRTGNTSPGADNITVKLLTAVCHIIGTHVRRLFEGCLAMGHHPKPFRAAEVVMIAKPGRRDLTTPQAWRPISQLSCLGKRLERLILRLREQGWPEHLARWAGSFMDDRSACVRYQDTITPLSPLQCGLPQGLPVSPILFLLYTEPIYRLSNPQGRFSYADDTAILCVGDTVEETAAAASRSVEEMVRWGAANGVSFDPKKTEVMHFSRSKLETAPAICHGDVEKHPEAAMRWLGIWLDSSLSFRVHAEKWTAKSQAVTYHLRGLTNTIHGPLPSAVRSAVRACVEPVLLYGTEVWYPGATRPRWEQPSKDRPSGIQHLLQIMNKAIVQSMRAILPVWKTTPTAILHRESGIPPITQLLEACRYRFSARLKSLDEAHLLAKRTLPPRQPTYHQLIKRKYQAPAESNFRTRLRRTNELLAPSPRPALMQKCFGKGQDTPLQTARKEESAETFLQWVSTVDPATWIVYPDGSLSSEGAASYGFAIHQKDLSICDGSGRLGSAEVFDAEATGALEGLKAALNL